MPVAIRAISRTRSSPRTSLTVLRCCRDNNCNACDEADEEEVAVLPVLRVVFPLESEDDVGVVADGGVEVGLEGLDGVVVVEGEVTVVFVTTKCLSAAAAMMGL